MKQFIIGAIFVVGVLFTGCGRVVEYVVYGPCGDATFTIVNRSGMSVNVIVGGSRKSLRLSHGDTLFVPARYPEFSSGSIEIPITAFPANDEVGPATTIWRFSHYRSYSSVGRPSYHSGSTRGQSVHAVLEFSETNARRGYSGVKTLVFRTTQHH